jgi:seryl-tRNA synthetase
VTAPLFRVDSGLATLGPQLVALRSALERRFLAWAEEIGAPAMLFPPLIRAAELEKLDYFRNFPHLAVVASRILPERLDAHYARGGTVAQGIPGGDLADGEYVLPSAACYNVYLHLAGTVLDAPRYVTTVATCFRNESSYDELQRLWSFSMREIVCLGTAEEVQRHLGAFKERVLGFAAELGLVLDIEVASDPFYQPGSSRALMAKLFPQKEELVYGRSLAIASLNFHRNFFGERCGIRTAGGEPAFTGCVAFGIERWLHALLDRFGGDADTATAAVTAALAATAALAVPALATAEAPAGR